MVMVVAVAVVPLTTLLYEFTMKGGGGGPRSEMTG